MDLLLEIGTEEIPSGYIPDALRQMKDLAESMLKNNRISFSSVKTYGTPRRLVLVGKGLSEKQKDEIREIKGPPKNVAFDKDGNPTKAAISFAQKSGVSLDEIETVKTKKGEYLFIRKKIPGKRTEEILKEELPKLILSISWPKSMRWADKKISFARPIHWILCIFDGRPIQFEIEGIRSDCWTKGHRFMSKGRIEVKSPEEYFEKLRKAYVIVDPEERKRLIMDQIKKEADTVNGIPADDPDLLETVTYLVEYPYAILGSFEERFLSLPEPVLITCMKEHQKYFAVYSKDGRLLPNFIAINNTVPKDKSLVREGHERVLKARLSDAEFFFKEDQKRRLIERLEELKGVIFHAKLGSSYEKVERFTKIAEYIASQVIPEKIEDVRLVCRLCKCDLLTLMVGEFPDLQGIMGMEYAKREGYPEHICRAIYEHYLPTGSSDRLPKSEIGAVVGIADRIDTICGYFAIGIKPTGSADPFALRRHALSVIRIIEDKGWDISLRDLVRKALSLLKEKGLSFDEKVEEEVISFFKDRYRYMMLKEYPQEVVDSVIAVSFDRIKGLREWIDQINEFSKDKERFVQLVLTAKRVSNILKKQKERYPVDEKLFNDTEKRLWKKYVSVKEEVEERIKEGKYIEASSLLLSLKKEVDDLFDNVEILTKDETLRKNRVGLVQNLDVLFKKVADFSKFPY